MDKDALKKLIEELISLGENKAELELMFEMFDLLDDEAQQALVKNLTAERDALKK